MKQTPDNLANLCIANDHGGIETKQAVVEMLDSRGVMVHDFGCAQGERVDYPEYAAKVASAVAAGEYEAGILVCGTGIGMSIAANQVAGIRAALVTDPYTATMSRAHNDANVLCLSGRNMQPFTACELVRIWIETEFEGGRHVPRLEKIEDIR